MDVSPLPVAQPRTFSLRRSLIIASVVFVHGMLGLWLSMPATPRLPEGLRARARASGKGLILVFLSPPADSGRRSSRAMSARSLHRAREHGIVLHRSPPLRHRRRRQDRAPPATPPARRLELALPQATHDSSSAPTNDVPRYVAGGQTFREHLHAVRRQEQRHVIRADNVTGMPHFAMRDPRTHGVAGALHFITHSILGAADPACVEAATESTLSQKQQAKRHVDMDAVDRTLAEHRCVLRPDGWMAPDGPATHLTARPPGHGME